ncbi:uncharacterized protein LOC111873669 isoform X2 [Cryptotermes secundus]|uniref:uncharacterized protein LOC111873669 isoform X2 n=1 Tax=Cryptotermes secundus TaxID=105785 RepID=UPI000CD7DA5B|nr:uncharacterized protein LOC111873669 isoform X2 [Cryptotermes secundus]
MNHKNRVFPRRPSNMAYQFKTYYQEVKEDLLCEQSVNYIPTIVNGHLNFNNLPLASDNITIKENHARTLVIESEVKMSENKTKDTRGLKHKILTIGESHVRGCAVRMFTSMDDRFEVCGIVMPGSCTNALSGTMSDEVDKSAKNDFLIISSGSNDVSKSDTRIAFSNIVNFIKNIRHTNVILTGVPLRYDTPGCSQLNDAINLFNNKLSKLTKIFSHVFMSEPINNRLLYTKYGSHLNTLGKEIFSNQLVSQIFLLLERVKVTPIILEWYDKVTQLVVPSIDKSSSTLTSTQRNVKRNRKLPVTRNNDFLWNIEMPTQIL